MTKGTKTETKTVVALLCWLALTLVATLATPPIAAADPSEVWTWTTRAVQLLTKGDAGHAVAAVARARKARALPELDALVGIIGLAGGEVKAGRQQLERAIERGSTEPLVFYWAGRAALRAGALGPALKRLQHAQAIAGSRPALQMGRALLLARLNKPEQAVRALEAVARLTPNLLDPRLYPTPTSGAIELLGVIARRFPQPVLLRRTQGHLSWQSGDVLGAVARFGEVLAKRPRDLDALRMLARCEHALGADGEALRRINRAIDLDADGLDSFGVRGMLLKDSDPTAAARDLKKAATGSPRDVDLLIALGEACAATQRSKCARRFFTYALRRDPRKAAAHFGQAVQLQLAGKLAEAERSFSLALALDSGNPRFYEGAANFFQVKGDGKRARQLLRAARAVKPVHARFARLRRGAVAAANRSWKALGVCGCRRGAWRRCQQPKSRQAITLRRDGGGPPSAVLSSRRRQAACRKAVARLSPRAVRSFFRAHLLLSSGRRLPPTIKDALTEIVARNRVRRLLLTDPTILKLKGKTPTGLVYTVSAHLPMVRPSLLY